MTATSDLKTSSDAGFALLFEEIVEKLQSGEGVDVGAYVQQYPEHAERLRRLLPAVSMLAELGQSAGRQNSAGISVAGAAGPDVGVLGDFRILREVGRGGMGIVYEAEQISLGRRVALKVLPFASTMDPRHLQRFKNEAQAAGQLHHTNIVPVFATGCERGVHFYAMQFIDGQTLAAVIRELAAGARPEKPVSPAPQPASAAATQARPAPAPPTPLQADPDQETAASPAAQLSTDRSGKSPAFFRSVAQLGIQAAGALEHAHQLGVIHRDVKPGNLMLDGRGQLWVTDFGLAQVQSNPQLTMTGDLVGTLRYMSPEQALAKRVVIDHRTDVYSLGATLYELLTLQPVFAGQDRQELLRQIAFEEPRPPRKLNRAIPGELETIVLKALEKNPAERYGTAQEVADELRRFFEDKPIRARRPSWRQLAAKWARRHRPVVWAATVVLLVAAALAGGFGLWRLQQRAAAEREAEVALQEAGRLREEEKWPEALLTIRRAEPLLKTGLLGERLRQRVKEQLDDLKMVDRLEQIRLQKAALKEEDSNYRRASGAYLEAFREYGIDVTALRVEETVRRIRARAICVELAGALDDCAAVYRGSRCREMWVNGRHIWPKELLALARAADPDEQRNRLRDALERRDAAALKEVVASGRVARLPPSTLVLLGQALARTGAAEEALAVLREGQRRHPGNFWVNYELAEQLSRQGGADLGEAVRYFTASMALRPRSPVARSNLGAVLLDMGRLDEAIAELREAIRLKEDYPDAHHNLGLALEKKGRLDEAIAEYREAIRFRKNYPEAHYNLCITLMQKGQLREAVEEIRLSCKYWDHRFHDWFGQAERLTAHADQLFKVLKEVVKPADGGECMSLACFCMNLGDILRDKGRLEEAIAAYHEAIRFEKRILNPYIKLGNALLSKGRLDEAVAVYQEALRRKKDFAPARHNLRQAEEMARVVHRLPAILQGKDQPKDAAEAAALARLCQQPYKQLNAAATRFYMEAFAADPKLAPDLNSGHRYNAACAGALAGCGQGQDAGQLDAKERSRLREQARDWLAADLRAWRNLLQKEPKARPEAAQQLAHWQADPDFAGVRGEKAFKQLPQAEREAWRQLWTDVKKTLDRARRPAK